MVYFDTFYGTNLWIKRSFKGGKSVCFWIWHGCIWITWSHTTCHMHVDSKKWNEALWKHLHSVGQESFAAIRVGTFFNLKKVPQLLYLLLCPRYIHSPKGILLYDWQRLWVKFIIISDTLLPNFIKNLCCLDGFFFSSSQLAVFPLAQVISKGILLK